MRFRDDFATVLLPWRWPAYRFLGFALMNAAIAAGIIVGFTPHPRIAG